MGFDVPWLPPEPFEAKPYVPPPPPVSQLKLIDNKDGTITTPDYGRMWAQKDSYSDLGHCLDYYQSVEYVKKLRTGGYDDWRIPRIGELAILFDNTQENIMAWDHNPEFPMAMSKIFYDGAAYWYWSSDISGDRFNDCCSDTLYFVSGILHTRRLSMCNNGGVRAVREIR